MIRKSFCLLIPLLQIALVTFAQIPIGIGQWRTHVPYRNATSVTDAGDRVYVSGNVFFFSYYKATGEIQRFDKVTGLSDVGVSLVRYNPNNSILLIAYENANIDLIIRNTILNIADIRRKLIVGDKRIYHIYFEGDIAYLSCGFGIVVLDMKRREIKDTYVIGNNGASIRVFSVSSDDNSFYAATEQGLKVASRNAPNLANYAEWITEQELPSSDIKQVVNFNNKIFVNANDTLRMFDGISWNAFYSDTSWRIENVVATADNLMICETGIGREEEGRLRAFNDDLSCCEIEFMHPALRWPTDASVDVNGTLWISDLINGLIRKPAGNDEIDLIIPNAPISVNVQNMSVRQGELWVAPGGAGPTVSNKYNREGVFYFRSNWWDGYNQYSTPPLSEFLSIYDVAQHPQQQDKVYLGSWLNGLAEYSNGSFTVYDNTNSILKGVVGDTSSVIISGLAFDSRQNLWMTSFGSPFPLIVKRADETWQSFTINGIDENGLTAIEVDDYDQIWMTVPKSNSQGIVVFTYGNDLDNPTQSHKILRTGPGSGNLPSNEVLCLAKDLDGEIWVGTAEGIAVFYCPFSVFSQQGCDAQQIIVTQEGVAGYLLENERISVITVDGADRKWIGTSNGLFVLSPEGTEEIAYYNVDNSPLLSNIITSIAIDDETGEAFIGTEKGIVSVRGDATLGDEAEHSDVLVFPNPVRENYDGPIAIRGLAQNANVKITDVNGMLFYETTALGGQAVWNGRNYHGEKAKTGVYLVFTSNSDGSSTHVTKLLIIN